MTEENTTNQTKKFQRTPPKSFKKKETTKVAQDQKAVSINKRLQARLRRTKESIDNRSFVDMTEFELLDYALSFIISSEKVTNISNKLITKHGSIYQLVELPLEVIQNSIPNLPHVADFLSFLGFLVLGRIRRQVHESPIFKNGTHLREYLSATIGRSRHEHLRVLYLDSAGHLIADEELSEPTPAVVTIPFHKIFRQAILRESSGFVLVRNIPDNNVNLNKEEIASIQQLHDFCRIMSLEMLDFLVLRGDLIESLFECGLIHD